MKSFTHFFLILVFFISIVQTACSQGITTNVSRSLVKITINQNGVDIITASGFVWQSKDQVVTSLHVMRPGALIKLEWDGDSRGVWNAEVMKVHKKADLVLLKVTNSALGLPGWTPIMAMADSKNLQFMDDIFALGYNHGAKGWATRALKKGGAQFETLVGLIPEKDVNDVRTLGMPSIDLDIIYLEGSLLPGYSGAPIVNSQGALIGIGDGGLENGASNVSWGIPAHHLNDLVKSDQLVLPTNIGHASQTFSAEINTPKYKTLDYGKYHFIHTKTRTLAELIESSDEPERINAWFEDVKNMNIDFNRLEYDIYEDDNFGVIITVPKDYKLLVTGNELKVELGTNDYSLAYVARDGVNGNEAANIAYYKKYYSDYYTSQGYTIQNDVAEDTIIVTPSKNILSTTGLFIKDASGNEFLQYVYYKTAFNNRSSLMALSFLSDFDNDKLRTMGKCNQAGVNCMEVNQNSACYNSCSLIYTWYYILTSVSLTGFANQ